MRWLASAILVCLTATGIPSAAQQTQTAAPSGAAHHVMEDFLADAYAGHKIVATVFCETQSFSRKDGPERRRPLNEVEVANGIAALSATRNYGDCRLCAGIVGHANLTFGARIGDLLDRCMAAAPDKFHGVRHVTVEYPDERPFRYIMTYKPPAGVLDNQTMSKDSLNFQNAG